MHFRSKLENWFLRTTCLLAVIICLLPPTAFRIYIAGQDHRVQTLRWKNKNFISLLAGICHLDFHYPCRLFDCNKWLGICMQNVQRVTEQLWLGMVRFGLLRNIAAKLLYFYMDIRHGWNMETNERKLELDMGDLLSDLLDTVDGLHRVWCLVRLHFLQYYERWRQKGNTFYAVNRSRDDYYSYWRLKYCDTLHAVDRNLKENDRIIKHMSNYFHDHRYSLHGDHHLADWSFESRMERYLF